MAAIRYVVGLAYTENKSSVLLIRKNRPSWQKGFLNGIGGKIEESDQSPLSAMIREFEEETGLQVSEWEHFCSLTGSDYEVEFFRTHTDSIHNAKAMTDEIPVQIRISEIMTAGLIPNLRGLVLLGLEPKINLWVKEP